MSYSAREQSDYGGHPLELYRFAMGDNLWLFTTADHEVAHGEEVYTPLYVKRGNFTKAGDAKKAGLDIELSATNPLALQFRSGWLSSTMVVTILRHHYEDYDFSVLWKGRVTGCTWSGSVARLRTESVATSFQRAGLRRVYQVGCPHQLYGPQCGVAATSYAVSLVVAAASGAELEVTGAGGHADGYFIGGMMQSGDDRRLIVGHSGVDITLVDGVDGLEAGATITLWPGCDKATATCNGRFGNIVNFGGLPYLPSKNPFSGDALV